MGAGVSGNLTASIPKGSASRIYWESDNAEVASVNKVGAFLNWGLMKDLLVPYNEQRSRMKQGRRYLVYTYLDDTTKRIVASSKYEKFLGNTIPMYEKGDKVKCLVCDENEIGYKLIIDDLHKGIIYKNEIFYMQNQRLKQENRKKQDKIT